VRRDLPLISLYARIGSEDQALRLYDQLRHEIFNQPEYKEVMTDMED
jgi:alpha-beta hydrolase superfamily lysophospholipase